MACNTRIKCLKLYFIDDLSPFQVVRLEDKESEMKKEYSKLHERYTELFKTHIDYMERTKSILGTERLDQIGPGAARPRIAGMALNQLNRYLDQHTFKTTSKMQGKMT